MNETAVVETQNVALRCDRCKKIRPFTFNHARESSNGFQWLWMFACDVCGSFRQWGYSQDKPRVMRVSVA